MEKELSNIRVTLSDGQQRSMADWDGHVVLIVNTASQSDEAEQLETLQELFDDYMMRGFFVLAVPCNQFDAGEPGTDEDISRVYADTYGVTFPVLAKTDVNGAGEHPLYTWLKRGGAEVAGNFEKFVVFDNAVVGRFPSEVEPDEMPIIEVIEQHLPV